MATITYDDKVQYRDDTSIDDIYKCTADDMNEIKDVVNENYETLETIDETLNVSEDSTITDEDTSMQLDNTTKGIFKEFDLKGNTEQDGTPTPDSPIDVNVVSGDNEIVVCGKNLFDVDIDIITPGYYNASDNLITSDTTLSCQSSYIKVNPNTEYTISSSESIIYRICEYDSSKTFIQRIYNESAATSYTITTGNTTEYIRMAGTLTTALDSLQIEEGSTATDYEEYTGETYEIDLGDIELCKIGTYQDYFYKEDDTWYLYKAIGEVVLDGSEEWFSLLSVWGTNGYGIANYPSNFKQWGRILSNYFVDANISAATILNNGTMALTGSSIVCKNDNTTTLELFTTWLSSNNVSVYYVLETPTTTEITDTTLISQLNAIANAISYDGETNISQVSNDLPFILNVEAFTDTYNGRYENLQNKCDVLEERVETLEDKQPVVLYSGSDSASTTGVSITLNDDISNYKYLDIDVGVSTTQHNTFRLYLDISTTIQTLYLATTSYNFQFTCQFSETTCTFIQNSISGWTGVVATIFTVIGYK